MHSGVVFWGNKAELRQIMEVVERTDAQVQMFEQETGSWTLHVNFVGGEVSRLRLENARLRAELAGAAEWSVHTEEQWAVSCGDPAVCEDIVQVFDDLADAEELAQRVIDARVCRRVVRTAESPWVAAALGVPPRRLSDEESSDGR